MDSNVDELFMGPPEEEFRCNKEFDEKVEGLLFADDARVGSIPGTSKIIHLVEYPWSMKPTPWRVFWKDLRTDKVCLIMAVGDAEVGEKYTMFTTYDEFEKKALMYVFLNNQYHYCDEDGENE